MPSEFNDESFLGNIEQGIDVLLTHFDEDEIYISDSSSEPEWFSIDEPTEEYISNSVDHFEEVCCSFNIDVKTIQTLTTFLLQVTFM